MRVKGTLRRLDELVLTSEVQHAGVIVAGDAIALLGNARLHRADCLPRLQTHAVVWVTRCGEPRYPREHIHPLARTRVDFCFVVGYTEAAFSDGSRHSHSVQPCTPGVQRSEGDLIMTRKAVRRNSFSRRDFLQSLTTTIGLAALGGCCPPEMAQPAPTPTPTTLPASPFVASGPTILNFMAPILQNVALRDVLEWIIDRWHESHNLIKIEAYWTDGQSIPEKLYNLLESGDTSVDLAVMGFENLPTFIGAGFAAPLDIPDIEEFAREQVKIVTRAAKVYGVPLSVDVKGYIYNKRLYR